MLPYTPCVLPGRSLPELLLESLRRMTAAGHQPGRYVVLRLTDGRIRALALTDELDSPLDIISQIRNESGPLSSAFLVGSKTSYAGVRIFVEDLLDRRRLELPACIADLTRSDGTTNQALAVDRPKSADLTLVDCSRPFTTIAAG